jgi:hypothetical protein
MLDNILMVWLMGTDNIFGLTGLHTKATLSMELDMAMEFG